MGGKGAGKDRDPCAGDLFILASLSLDRLPAWAGLSSFVHLPGRGGRPLISPLHEKGPYHRHTGQDVPTGLNSFLAKGYEVHGVIRRASTFNTSRIGPSLPRSPTVNGTRLFPALRDLADSVRW